MCGMATMNKFILVAASLVTLFLGNANAFWRLECDGSVGLARMDPLMNYGTAGDHAHSIKGGSGKPTNFRILCYLYASLLSGQVSKAIVCIIQCSPSQALNRN